MQFKPIFQGSIVLANSKHAIYTLPRSPHTLAFDSLVNLKGQLQEILLGIIPHSPEDPVPICWRTHFDKSFLILNISRTIICLNSEPFKHN